MLRFLPVQKLSLSSDVHSSWMRRQTSRLTPALGQRWGLTFGESYLPSRHALFCLHKPLFLPFLAYRTPFSHHLGGRGERWTVCLLASSYYLRSV